MALGVKNPPASAADSSSVLELGRSPGVGNGNLLMLATSDSRVLDWKPRGQRRLAGYSPWGHRESDVTEHAHAHCVLQTNILFYGSMLAGGERRISPILNTVSDGQFYI